MNVFKSDSPWGMGIVLEGEDDLVADDNDYDYEDTMTSGVAVPEVPAPTTRERTKAIRYVVTRHVAKI